MFASVPLQSISHCQSVTANLPVEATSATAPNHLCFLHRIISKMQQVATSEGLGKETSEVQLPPVDEDPTVEPLEAFTQEDIAVMLDIKERIARTVAAAEESLCQHPVIEL